MGNPRNESFYREGRQSFSSPYKGKSMPLKHVNRKFQLRNAFVGFIVLYVNFYAFAEEPVHFSCLKFKAFVERRVNKKNPTPSNMLDLTFLPAGCKRFDSIKGLEYATNLEELFLNGTTITDNDISCLSNLVKLEKLYLSNVNVTDFSFLAKLRNLETLSLGNNAVNDISMLKELKSLRMLFLCWNNIEDISILKGLTNLKYLNMRDNAIEDISALTNLHNLTYLNLRYNPLSKESLKIHVCAIRKNNPKMKEFDIYPYDMARRV